MLHKTAEKPVSLSRKSPWPLLCGIAGGLTVIAAAFLFLEIDFGEMFGALPAFASFFFERFFPPKFDGLGQYLPLLMETVCFAVVGTCISSILALFGGLLLCGKTNGIAWLRHLTRIVVSLLRNVPVLVWAAVLVFIFGIGNMVGLIALVIIAFGLLARSYAESLNEVAGEKIEAMRALGASKAQILVHGVLPEFVPAWINWTLFTFEISIRAAVILGMVGAGGIGIMVQTNLRLFKYHDALALIIVLVALILVTELVTNQLRKRIK